MKNRATLCTATTKLIWDGSISIHCTKPQPNCTKPKAYRTKAQPIALSRRRIELRRSRIEPSAAYCPTDQSSPAHQTAALAGSQTGQRCCLATHPVHILFLMDHHKQRCQRADPRWKNVSIIAICPRTFIMMVKFVHVGRNEYITPGSIKSNRQIQIGVRKIGKQHRQQPVKM